MNVVFEPHFKQKLLEVTFTTPITFESSSQVTLLRTQWMQALKAWHTPYKAVLDCSQVIIIDSPTMQQTWERFVEMLKSLHLRTMAGYSPSAEKFSASLPFCVYASRAEALQALHVRVDALVIPREDFRGQLLLESHFKEQFIELQFANPVSFHTASEVHMLKDKLTNQLMQWHTPWCLLVDCHGFDIQSPEAFRAWAGMLKFFKGVHMKDVLGYGARLKSDSPEVLFPVVRSRHLALQKVGLKTDPISSATPSVCRSKNTDPSSGA